MNNKTIRLLLTLVYSFPFVYLAMYLDFFFRSMIGWLIMGIVYLLLFVLSYKQKVILPLVVGSFVSTFLSITLNQRMANIEQWSSYFKPIETSSLILTITVICLLIQLSIYYLIKKNHHSTKY